MQDLGTLGGSNSFALGVNSAGQVIGVSDIAGNKGRHAFVYAYGRMFDIDSPIAGLTGFVAAGINDAMQIVGTAVTASGLTRGLVVTPVPEANGLVMWGVGLAGLALVASHRRRRG